MASSSDEYLRRMLRQMSPDLQQLTLKDCSEMKWSLKKKAMNVMFGAASSLAEQLDELDRYVLQINYVTLFILCFEIMMHI
jgi:hypothetical protein